MPLIRSRRISPLNINKNVTIGVAFPLDENNMFKGTETIEEQNKSNLINLLLTEPGERINLPNYGVGLKKLLFEQQINLDYLKQIIQDQTSRYISGIKVNNVQIQMSEDKHSLFITITYQSLLDAQEDSIQLNFN